MLESVKISRRQSEIRQALAGLVGKADPTEDEISKMDTLDTEYRSNETRFRAALISEDQERKEAKGELETRSEKEFSELVNQFELRQVALMLDEGKALDGATAEVVQELRANGGYRGVPVPFAALEIRSGETVASGTPDPKFTAPIIDRIFPDACAVRMGASIVAIDSGTVEYPVTTSAVTAGWAATETGSVAGPTVYSVTDRPLAPNSTLGVTMKITRKSLKQSGAALEQAVRRDMNGAISQELDRAVFLGAGSGGEPSGVLVGSYGINSTELSGSVTWAMFRAAITEFLIANAISSPRDVKILMRPEIWDALDDSILDGTAVSEWDRMAATVGAENVVMSANCLDELSPPASTALLTTVKNGVPPIFVGVWGAVDLIRDPYSDAASGGLRLTGLVTADVTISRAAQLQILTGVEG